MVSVSGWHLQEWWSLSDSDGACGLSVFVLGTDQAAQQLGICEAALKRICRRHRILKWPYRQLSSVQRRIADLRTSQRTVAGLGRAEDRLRRHELCLDVHAHQGSRRLHISVDVPESLNDQAPALQATTETEEAKMRALIDEHHRIVRSAHLQSTAAASPFLQCFIAEALHPVLSAAQHTTLANSAPSAPPALLALASACEMHAVARQQQRWCQDCSYQTAKLLGLVAPDDTALRDLAVVAASVPRAQ